MLSSYKKIKTFCNILRVKYVTSKIVNSLLFALGITLIICSILMIIFSYFPWTALPLFFDISVLAFILYSVIEIYRKTILKRPSLFKIAQLLEENTDKKHHYISIALELYNSKIYGSKQLVEKVCIDAAQSLNLYSRKIKNGINKKRVLATFLALLLFAGTFVLCNPKIIVWWDIPLNMFSSLRATLSPGRSVIPKNTSVILKCKPDKWLYPSSKLSISSIDNFDSETRTVFLRPDTNGIFSYFIDSLTQSVSYSFALGNKVFGPETITVVPPPVLYSFKISLTPPAYTEKPQSVLPEGQGTIAAYQGSRAEFSIGSVFPLRRATFIFNNTDTSNFPVTNGMANGQIQISRSGAYTFQLEDSLFQKSDSLPVFYINILPDYRPNVRIIKPGKNKLLASTQRETLWVEAVDDFGLREVSLKWKKSSDPRLYSKNIASKGKIRKTIRTQVEWDLLPMTLYPGDSVFYWIQARDNKPFGKPQISVTDTFILRLPTFSEIHEHISGSEDDADNAMTSAQKLQNEMKQKLESLIESAKDKKTLSWEEKQIVEDLGKSIKEQKDSLTNAIESLKKAVEKMRETTSNNEILEKMEDIQKAIKELINEYGDSLFFKPPEPDENLSWSDLKEAVEKMTELLPDLEERLDNALEYLKMLKKESDRALLADKAKKLSEEQLQISQSQDDDLKKLTQQGNLNKKIDDLLAGTKEKIADDPESPVKMEDIPSMENVEALSEIFKSQLSQKQMPSSRMMNQMSASLQGASQELEATLSNNMMMKAMMDKKRL
ncbi:MAG: hypothetical protein PVI26_14360, partial [Chitinispirillia bacterium]